MKSTFVTLEEQGFVDSQELSHYFTLMDVHVTELYTISVYNFF